jgi:hypothetical protein
MSVPLFGTVFERRFIRPRNNLRIQRGAKHATRRSGDDEAADRRRRRAWWQFTLSTKVARDQLLLVSRSLKRVTVFDDHCPPVALLIPRRFSSAAICRANGKWAFAEQLPAQ